LIDDSIYEKVVAVFEELGRPQALRPIHEALEEETDFATIKIALAIAERVRVPRSKINETAADPKKALVNATPATIGPASINDILGSNNGKPKPVFEPKVEGDQFGNRTGWKIMRGSNRKYNG
jgi:hypothetical protein